MNIDFPRAAELDPVAMAETLEATRLAKIQADATRDFVLAHYQKLRGQVMPMEIMGIQNLPNHSCLIVNDLLLLSYVEAEQLIHKLSEQT